MTVPVSAATERETLSDVLWEAAGVPRPAQDSMVSSVYKILWQQIVEGERQPGERFIETELVTELGVSRTPIRQALFQLQQAGLVEIGESRGFHVVIYGEKDIRELYELRAVLEVAAVRAAVPAIPEGALGRTQEKAAALGALSEPDLSPAFLHFDIDFHHGLIAGHCGNRRLSEAVAGVRARMGVFIADGTRVPKGTELAMREHAEILAALGQRDAETAAAAMARHLERVKEMALTSFAHSRTSRVRRFQSVRG